MVAEGSGAPHSPRAKEASPVDGGTRRIADAEQRGGVTRRRFLRALGMGSGTVLVVGAGALTWRAVDQGVFSTGEGAGYDAWNVWRSGNGLIALVRPAILAANAHNSQPWLFELGTDRIDVFADTRRSMGTMDAMNRLKPSWTGILTTVLALLYLYVGISSRGADTAAGLIGAALILLALPDLGLSRWIRESLLVAGALPLAVMTWWSLVTPILAILVIAFGSLAVGKGRKLITSAAP